MNRKIIICSLLLSIAALSGMSQSKKEFLSPDIKYHPIPLWFWNNTSVTKEEISVQMDAIKNRCGYGGVAILPFGQNFKPEYLSEEYFELYAFAARKAKELGIKMSLYDEYGFPSGSGGAINADGVRRFEALHPELTMKRLDKIDSVVSGGKMFEKKLETNGKVMAVVAMNVLTKERINLCEYIDAQTVRWSIPEGEWRIMEFVAVKDGDPNMDYLSREAAEAYIDMTHEQYRKRMGEYFGNVIVESFFDEPTLYRAKARVWSYGFNDEFQKIKGYSPDLLYPALWYDIGEETAYARNALHDVRSELYAAAYPKSVNEWSEKYGIKATGHQDNEEIENPVGTSADLMKCFKYLKIPGIDKIGGDRPAEKFYKVVSSAAYNWDNSLVMSETYGAMGNILWDEMYDVAMEQYTKGINVLIPHAVWYNDKDVWFLPELSDRNPIYAPRLKEFNLFLSRLNLMLQNDDRVVARVAMLYPIETLQSKHYFDGPLDPYAGGVRIDSVDYTTVGELLTNDLGCDFQYIHPEVLDEKCTVSKGVLRLDNRMQYNDFKAVILPSVTCVSVENINKLYEFAVSGGKVVFTTSLPYKSVEQGKDSEICGVVRKMLSLPDVCFIESPDVVSLSMVVSAFKKDIIFDAMPMRYIHKESAGRHIYYFANLGDADYDADIVLCGAAFKSVECLNPHTGEVVKMKSRYDIDENRIKVNIKKGSSLFITGRL